VFDASFWSFSFESKSDFKVALFELDVDDEDNEEDDDGEGEQDDGKEDAPFIFMFDAGRGDVRLLLFGLLTFGLEFEIFLEFMFSKAPTNFILFSFNESSIEIIETIV
jgi:hypothetical protein